MKRTQIIVINTIATYTRSIFSIGLALFSSRWVLEALGQSDFGLFSVVGSIIIFITFLNGVMAASAARFFAYSIGEGDTKNVRRWFNSTLSIHVCFAICLTLLGWPIGEYVVSHYMTIPEGRMGDALWVFRFSLVSAFFNMVSVPFVGMFTAKQRIAEMAGYGMLQSLSTFSLAYILTRLHGDRFIAYAFGMSGIAIAIQVLLVARASFAFQECKIVFQEWFDFTQIKRIASFGGWMLFGNLAYMLRDQGTAMLLNIRFGTTVNASYGIAGQVSSATNQLSSAMMGAFSPEIITSEGGGDRKRMLSYAQRANKYGTILILLFAIPLLIELNYVLHLWLKNPPQYTAAFCILILVAFAFDRLTSGYMLAVAADGRIAAYQATMGGALLLTLPIAWFILKYGGSPPSVCIAFIVTALLGSFGRVLWVKHLLGVPIGDWLRYSVLPCFTVVFLSTIVGLVCTQIMPSTFYRLMCVCACTFATSLLTIWFFAADPGERNFFKNSARRICEKLTGRVVSP